jgi:signal transduction histidine kinase/ActR/RegA family two-component response regulator
MITAKKISKNSVINIILYAVLGIAAFASLFLFIFYNNRSREAVQAEREDYTTEITNQLTRNIENIQNSYANEIREAGRTFVTLQPQSLSEITTIFPDENGVTHFLISDSGKTFDTSGIQHSFSDDYFKVNLAESQTGTVILSHSLVDQKDSYLLFGNRLEKSVTIEGTSYSALAIGVTSEQFKNNMTIRLFNGQGAGYLITEDGAIFIGPEQEKLVGGGYNLFAALEEGGVGKSTVSQLQEDMKNGQAKATLTVKDIQWMIEIKSTQFDNDYIVVAVPLTLTAAQTYLNMTLTVVFAFVFVTALAGITTLIIFSGLHRKREEDKKAAAVEAQTNFLAKMSHDIRTPLNAVNGMLELASDPHHSREEVNEFIGKASESSNYLLELINGMLDLQKINSGKMDIAHEPFSMGEILETIASMYKPVIEGKKLNFRLEGEDLFPVDYFGDSTKIKEILMNLLSNAMKFTPEGGSITLSASKRALGEKRDEVTLEVSDTGIGMSEEFKNHMFTPFEQEKTNGPTHYTGTGLGLSIVKSLSELMGGSVKVDSTLGKGSTFCVVLPFEKTGSALPKKPSNASLVPFNHQKVLLAEDNEINQQIVIMLLKERLSLDVTAVNNGQEAVDAFAASAPGTYSVILLDLQMPVMNGYEAAKTIRASKHAEAKTIPIIALSANAYAEDIKESLKAGMNAHLSKPINLIELSNKLHEYIK